MTTGENDPLHRVASSIVRNGTDWHFCAMARRQVRHVLRWSHDDGVLQDRAPIRGPSPVQMSGFPGQNVTSSAISLR